MNRKLFFIPSVEENARAGGAGSGVNELLAAEGVTVPILNIGLEDRYIQHGTRAECLHLAGLDMEGILERVNTFRDRVVDPDMRRNAVS